MSKDRIIINRQHCIEQFQKRFKGHAGEAENIVDRLFNALCEHTPDDWRFTESPSSRFFIVDEGTGAKFMGMSYREYGEGLRIVKDIQQNIHNNLDILDKIDANYLPGYIRGIKEPTSPIYHEIRTVYGKGKKANIAEEKNIFEMTRSVISHVLPLEALKIAARPNAVVTEDEKVWVRQHLNWMNMESGTHEYYLFHPLTGNGIEKGTIAVFSNTENGDIKKIGEETVGSSIPSVEPKVLLKKATNDYFPTFRSESYWKVPTYLDVRLIDLDFKERCPDKLAKEEQISHEERTELFFLRLIVKKAQEKMYRK